MSELTEAQIIEQLLALLKQIPVYQHRLAALHWLTARLAADERYQIEVKSDA